MDVKYNQVLLFYASMKNFQFIGYFFTLLVASVSAGRTYTKHSINRTAPNNVTETFLDCFEKTLDIRGYNISYGPFKSIILTPKDNRQFTTLEEKVFFNCSRQAMSGSHISFMSTIDGPETEEQYPLSQLRRQFQYCETYWTRDDTNGGGGHVDTSTQNVADASLQKRATDMVWILFEDSKVIIALAVIMSKLTARLVRLSIHSTSNTNQYWQSQS